MILPHYSALRHHFAEVARTTSVSLTYDHVSSPNTVSRAAGSFVTDGFEAGMSLDVANTTANDARYTVGTVAALSMTIAEQFNSSETITSSLTGAFYENDGAEVWPTTLVRANSFSSTWTLGTRPLTICPANLTVNNYVTDAAAGSSYRWYLRQRTDVAAGQWLSIVHADATRTGSVTIAITAAGVAALGLATATTKMSADQQARLLRNVTVFCRRDSDGAIQFVDLLQLSHGNYS